MHRAHKVLGRNSSFFTWNSKISPCKMNNGQGSGTKKLDNMSSNLIKIKYFHDMKKKVGQKTACDPFSIMGNSDLFY